MSDGIQPRSRLFLSYDVAYPFMVWSWIVLSSFLPVEVPPKRVPTWTEVIASCTDVASYRGSLTNSEPATRESRRLPPGSVVVLLLPWTPALEPTTCSSLALWITCKVWCPPCFTSSVHDGLCVREPPFPLSLVTPTLWGRAWTRCASCLVLVGPGLMPMWSPEWVTVL